jgi:hypothetical protein
MTLATKLEAMQLIGTNNILTYEDKQALLNELAVQEEENEIDSKQKYLESHGFEY